VSENIRKIKRLQQSGYLAAYDAIASEFVLFLQASRTLTPAGFLLKRRLCRATKTRRVDSDSPNALSLFGNASRYRSIWGRLNATCV